MSPDTRKILESMGHKFGPPQPANHLAVIIVSAPSLDGKAVGDNRYYGANVPRRNNGLAAGSQGGVLYLTYPNPHIIVAA